VTPTNSCLDGETLAAWVDGGLSRNDAAMAEAHVSACPRCQEIAGLIVKTTPATVVDAPSAAIADAPWWRRPAAWLVPVAAGATAAGLLLIAPKNPSPSPAPAPTAATAAAPAAATLESARTTATPSPPATIAPVAPPAQARQAEMKSAEARPAEAKPAEVKKERQRDERPNTAVEVTAVTAAPAAARSAAPTPPAAVAGASAAAPTAAPSAATTPAAASAVTTPAAAAGRVADQQLARQSFALAAKSAVSPDGKVHWRITDRGALERSTDGGTTWQAVNVGVTATFTTVQAPEPRTAIVTTTDGRQFRTTDAGTTWKLVPPSPGEGSSSYSA
jgi:hypothetical protein